jgi:hypothetical protein
MTAASRIRGSAGEDDPGRASPRRSGGIAVPSIVPHGACPSSAAVRRRTGRAHSTQDPKRKS